MFLSENEYYELEIDLTSSMNHVRTSKTLKHTIQLVKMQTND